jgi:hypothetical protein
VRHNRRFGVTNVIAAGREPPAQPTARQQQNQRGPGAAPTLPGTCLCEQQGAIDRALIDEHYGHPACA